MKKIKIKNFYIGEKEPLCIISGPCVIEDEDHTLQLATKLKNILYSHNVNYIFKASYDKANRSSIHSFRGPGLEKGLKILEKVKKELDIPILSDIHHPEEAEIASNICDIIQIPAFLCRQTDLLTSAAKTNSVINIKKGQFLSPLEMKNVIEKIIYFKNNKIMVTDRGTFFGYNNLVSDFRSIPIMKEFGFPVGFDASHSVQKPGALEKISGGDRRFIPILSKAAIAVGANFLYIESHDNPAKAKSDSQTVLDITLLDKLIPILKNIYETTLF